MKKQELENGMVVETRDKFRFLVIGDNLQGKDGYLKLQDYKDDMQFGNNHQPGYFNLDNFDIMKVYANMFAITDYKVAQQPLWERKETPRLTNDEIAILRNIDKKYIWLARDINGGLYIYEFKPGKSSTEIWIAYGKSVDLSLFSHMFKGITFNDKEPFDIKALLMQNKEEL